MNWGIGIRALALLRRGVIAFERQATAQETLARVALTESGLDRKQPKLVSIESFDPVEANKRFEREREARAVGVDV
jgi:hypothetical protein